MERVNTMPSVRATVIPAFLCGWPAEAWSRSFTNQLARPEVRLLKVSAGILEFFSMPVIALRLFAKGHRGIFHVHKMLADRTPGLTSIWGTAQTLMKHQDDSL